MTTRIVVTGAAGFIGSNLIKALNDRGVHDIIAVDELKQGDKFKNLADLQISDYWDADDFYVAMGQGHFGQVEAVFHQGACSDTMEQDGQYMMQNNYRCTIDLMQHCMKQGARFLYASSAATYGGSNTFVEHPDYEHPLNVYGYSKLLTDQVLRQRFGNALQQAPHQIVGFRYFNVYGPREQHKARMASVAFHQFHQYQQQGHVKLFEAYGGYEAGQQQRDFVHVDDVCAVNLWFYDHPDQRGIFNLGTGRAQPFNDVALAVINRMAKQEGRAPMSLAQAVEAGKIVYIPFPDALRGKYQSYTQADLSKLRQAGCAHDFMDVATGVSRYVTHLLAKMT